MYINSQTTIHGKIWINQSMQIWLDNFSSDEIVKKHTEAKTVITINLVKLGITKLFLKVAFKQPQPLICFNGFVNKNKTGFQIGFLYAERDVNTSEDLAPLSYLLGVRLSSIYRIMKFI